MKYKNIQLACKMHYAHYVGVAMVMINATSVWDRPQMRFGLCIDGTMVVHQNAKMRIEKSFRHATYTKKASGRQNQTVTNAPDSQTSWTSFNLV